jgi:preprotein translocase subunit SecD
VAQTPPSAGHPGRQLIVLGLVFVTLFGLMFFSGTSGMSWRERLEPRLGLDLVGGTRVALQAQTEGGGVPEESSLQLAREIIESRVNAVGVEEAEVVTEGSDQIVISIAGAGEDSLRSVGQPAELRFRLVLDRQQGTGLPAEPPTYPDLDADLHRALGDRGGSLPERDPNQDSAEQEPEAEPEQPAAEDSQDSGADLATREEREASVREKVSDQAMQAALALTQPAPDTDVEALAEQTRPFEDLTGPEVAVLPAKIQYYTPAIHCGQLLSRPAGSVQDPDEIVVACDSFGGKMLLDTSDVLGTDIEDANASLQAGTTDWEVILDFNGEGQDRWAQLTREAVNNESGTAFDPSQLTMNITVDEETGEWSFDEAATETNNRYGVAPDAEEPAQTESPALTCGQNAIGDQGNCLVAAVLDNEVVTAPQVIQVQPGGTSRITGDFTSSDAQQLAAQLRFGALPLTFEAQEEQTVSATLGVEYLKAGLLAGAIGIALVLLYTLFYYRLLGLVIFGSLIVSSLLTYAALVVLGRGIGFTLTLAGISGFIVAVGIAADSFVIYFERLKDEIREGRTPRSAVPRAWARARRTIISANAVTLLAVVTLYLLSAGQVRGFAFALGIATIVDLLVVFTFRHPMMTLLARSRAFLSPTVSGLGRALALDRARLANLGGRRTRQEAPA